jgi:tRNA threonylcarbamoyladenosine biosynthesis protein TsaB
MGSAVSRLSEIRGLRLHRRPPILVCHAVQVTPESTSPAAPQAPYLLLGIDTCGPSGSVALGRLTGDEVDVLSEIMLEGRTYSSTLVTAVAEMLERHGISLNQVGCLVVVSGPGSFTGVRIGLGAVKGLSEGAGTPVIAVSRLQVLAAKVGIANAALDAHRHEIFLRLEGRELLAGATELVSLASPTEIAVCDSDAAALLEANWASTTRLNVAAPIASDALRFAIHLVHARQFADIALLDGHYLRRSDAEIFGNPAAAHI